MFIGDLGTGGTSEQNIDLIVSSECKDLIQKITFTITFEYVENNERRQGSATESVSLSVVQKDRLDIKEPQYDEYIEAGMESVITISYTNKGFTSLYNMEAELSLDDAAVEQPTVFIGNLDSGKNGSLSFLVTPYDEGDYEGVVTLTYEDSAHKEASIDIPVRFTSMMGYDPYDDEWYEEDYEDYEDIETENWISRLPLPLPWMIVIAAAVVLLIIIVIVCIVKHKRKKRKEEEMDDWLSGDA